MKAHKYKQALAEVFGSEKRKIQQLLHFRAPLAFFGQVNLPRQRKTGKDHGWSLKEGTPLWQTLSPSGLTKTRQRAKPQLADGCLARKMVG